MGYESAGSGNAQQGQTIKLSSGNAPTEYATLSAYYGTLLVGSHNNATTKLAVANVSGVYTGLTLSAVQNHGESGYINMYLPAPGANNIAGGNITITAQDGCSTPANNRSGGNVVISGGAGYGTGTKGIVTASRLRADGFATATAAKTADYTATLDDGTIEVDASGAARTITLFAASGNAGKIIVVKKTDSSANAVIIDGNAVETIDGAATTVLSTQWALVMLQVNATGTAWIKI